MWPFTISNDASSKYRDDVKSVNFSQVVKVILIPCRYEYAKAGIFSELWHSNEEFNSFKLSAVTELRAVMEIYNIPSTYDAMTVLYQPYINELVNQRDVNSVVATNLESSQKLSSDTTKKPMVESAWEITEVSSSCENKTESHSDSSSKIASCLPRLNDSDDSSTRIHLENNNEKTNQIKTNTVSDNTPDISEFVEINKNIITSVKSSVGLSSCYNRPFSNVLMSTFNMNLENDVGDVLRFSPSEDIPRVLHPLAYMCL